MFILTYELFCASEGRSWAVPCADPTDYLYIYLYLYLYLYPSIYLSIYLSMHVSMFKRTSCSVPTRAAPQRSPAPTPPPGSPAEVPRPRLLPNYPPQPLVRFCAGAIIKSSSGNCRVWRAVKFSAVVSLGLTLVRQRNLRGRVLLQMIHYSLSFVTGCSAAFLIYSERGY